MNLKHTRVGHMGNILIQLQLGLLARLVQHLSCVELLGLHCHDLLLPWVEGETFYVDNLLIFHCIRKMNTQLPLNILELL